MTDASLTNLNPTINTLELAPLEAGIEATTTAAHSNKTKSYDGMRRLVFCCGLYEKIFQFV